MMQAYSKDGIIIYLRMVFIVIVSLDSIVLRAHPETCLAWETIFTIWRLNFRFV